MFSYIIQDLIYSLRKFDLHATPLGSFIITERAMTQSTVL